MGLTMDGSGFGWAALAALRGHPRDGVVSWVAVEPGPGLSVSSAEEALGAL